MCYTLTMTRKKQEPRLIVEMDRTERQAFKVKAMSEGKTMRDKVLDWIREYLRS